MGSRLIANSIFMYISEGGILIGEVLIDFEYDLRDEVQRWI